MHNPLSLLGYLLMVGSLVALILTGNMFSSAILVVVPQAAAVALMIWARIVFGRRSFHLAASPTEGGLVITGPYRFIRHPIYAAICLFVTAGVASHLSGVSILFGLLAWAGAIIRMLCEERMLVQRYPAYQQYAATTARMVPGVF